MLSSQPLPEPWASLPEAETLERIVRAKAALGKKLFILGHHYQMDEIIRFADARGDSYRLSQIGSQQTEAQYIVFCGVHFMAESADILAQPGQQVILPDLAAGCSMADMATADQTEDAWETLESLSPGRNIPLTYMNSSAAIKAFVGKHGGSVTTSSNCRTAFEWAWEQRDKILFIPDEHLGRNTAFAMGVPLAKMAVWNPHLPQGGLTDKEIKAAKIILWKGCCSVHQKFGVADVPRVREALPGVKVIVHPECRYGVCQLADFVGSTDFIIKTITAAPAGSKWAVGTEIHLTNRLAQENPDKTIVSLAGIQCLCSTMFRIDPPHLLWVLENLLEGRVVNRIVVEPETKHWAQVALNRMLGLKAKTIAPQKPTAPAVAATAASD
ncbi:MAG: quinolinate synthase NadA [Planctomycetota bacterium]